MHYIITNTWEGITLDQLQKLNLISPMVIQNIDASQYLFDIDNSDIKILSSNIPLSEQMSDKSGFAEHNGVLYFDKTWIGIITPPPCDGLPKTIYFNAIAKEYIRQYCIDVQKRNEENTRCDRESENLPHHYRPSSDPSPSAKRLKRETRFTNSQTHSSFFLQTSEERRGSGAAHLNKPPTLL